MLRILQQQAALGEPGGRDLWPRAVAESTACSPFPGVKSWAFPKIIAESATGADLETESAMPLLLLIRPPNVASKYPKLASLTLNILLWNQSRLCQKSKIRKGISSQIRLPSGALECVFPT